MRIISGILIVILLLLGITFACLNAELVAINYYVGSTKLPLSLLLVIVLFIGALLGLLVGFIVYIRLQSKNRKLRQRLKVVETEVTNLRALPLQDAH